MLPCPLRALRVKLNSICFFMIIILFLLVLLYQFEIMIIQSKMKNHRTIKTVKPEIKTSSEVVEDTKLLKEQMKDSKLPREKMKDTKLSREDFQKQQVNYTEEMIFRKKVMKNACHKRGLDRHGIDSLHQVNPWEYFINEKYKLVWCNIFKSASSSWMYIFNVLSGYSPEYLEKSKRVPLNMARDKYGRPKEEELLKMLRGDNVTSMIIGRFVKFCVSRFTGQ